MPAYHFTLPGQQLLVWTEQQGVSRSVRLQSGTAHDVKDFLFVGAAGPGQRMLDIANIPDEVLCQIAVTQYLRLPKRDLQAEYELDLALDPITEANIRRVG